MLPLVPLGHHARVAAALVAAAACVAAAIAGFTACLTAPPSDIGTSANLRPSIVHGAVYPPEGVIRQWPPDGVFVVPVQLPDPTATCRWRDFDQDTELPPPPTPLDDRPCTTSLLDGGVIVQNAPIMEPTDGHCHVFTFIVAHGFSAETVPDSIGGDSVRWEYEPPSALCNFYDAGAFQDGAFPPADAGSDSVLVTPESGPGDSGVDP
jgi:hypothetical protein